VLVIDEVADAIDVGNVLEITRSHLQAVYRDMAMAIAGSKPTMMTRLFASTDQPFYSQARRVELGPLPIEAVVGIVHDGFERTDRRAGPVASSVAQFGSGHPQRSMASEGRFHDLSNSSITSARDTLVDAGHLVHLDGRTALADPLLADWIRRELP
jgi:hypothetical protein